MVLIKIFINLSARYQCNQTLNDTIYLKVSSRDKGYFFVGDVTTLGYSIKIEKQQRSLSITLELLSDCQGVLFSE